MNKIQYKEYLNSSDWLIKKSQLVCTYIKQNWDISCYYCSSKQNLNVHHRNYNNVGNENIKDESIWDLAFLCKTCHYKHHYEVGFKERQDEIKEMEFLQFIKDIKF